MHSIISIVGISGSGKTTLLERLIAELKGRGHKVGIVKHSHHASDLDTKTKDTWRFSKAGSEFSALNSLDNLAIYRHIDDYFDPQDLSNFILWDYDIILTEGFKSSNYPKIEVHNSAQGDDLITDPSLLLAVVSDKPVDTNVPQFLRDDVSGVADFIEKAIIKANSEDSLNVVINGSSIPMTPAQKDSLKRSLLAILPSTETNGNIKTMHISLRRHS